MHQEPAGKLHLCDCDILCLIGVVIFCSKRNMSVYNRSDPGITNGNPVCISAEVINGIFKPVKGLFDKGNP